ncbi:MAG: hypothetical protein HYV08_01350 [Deltaproteobacteria bacterium]|nr:hypothetical protein [Deltaproteobacteria bacterium]
MAGSAREALHAVNVAPRYGVGQGERQIPHWHFREATMKTTGFRGVRALFVGSVLLASLGLVLPMDAANNPAFASSSIMVHGGAAEGSGIPVSAFDVFFGFGGAKEYRVPRNGVIQRMRVHIEINSFGAAAEVAIFVNGTLTAISATIPAGSTADIDVPGAVHVADGDRIAVRLDRSAVPSFGQFIVLSVSYVIH